jgi:hypothetical protein
VKTSKKAALRSAEYQELREALRFVLSRLAAVEGRAFDPLGEAKAAAAALERWADTPATPDLVKELLSEPAPSGDRVTFDGVVAEVGPGWAYVQPVDSSTFRRAICRTNGVVEFGDRVRASVDVRTMLGDVQCRVAKEVPPEPEPDLGAPTYFGKPLEELFADDLERLHSRAAFIRRDGYSTPSQRAAAERTWEATGAILQARREQAET